RAALAAAETFNAEFEQWTRSSSLEEDAEMVRELYEENPTAFTQWDEFLTENFSHTVYRRGELICVSAAYYTFLGGPHPNTSFYARNFDLGRGAFFKVPELAEDPQAFTLFVADEIERQAREWIAELFEEEDLDLEDVYWENYREIMESWADYAVAFDDTGMSVTFSAYDLASYAAGPQEFFLSYEELAPFWSESGRQVLGLD
ncbi:MAG: DUF3298 domain-containing protein, partial [Oscillibacter sp.]|nr:DUF3298 domain-containing protein [Oscillibacter sp.]